MLIYAVSATPENAAKRLRAWELIDGAEIALSVQVLQEFYVQATRPTRSDRLDHDTATAFIEAWRRFPVQETTLALLDLGFEIQTRYLFSHWDSMIVAAARAQGCAILWTEDLSDGRIVDGMRIADPFR